MQEDQGFKVIFRYIVSFKLRTQPQTSDPPACKSPVLTLQLCVTTPGSGSTEDCARGFGYVDQTLF